MITRIGNDVKGLEWSIKRRKVLSGGMVATVPVDLAEATEINISVYHSLVRTNEIKAEVKIEGSKVLINVPADSIPLTGAYNIVLKCKLPDLALSSGVGTHTQDWLSAFTIVASTEDEDFSGSTNSSTLLYIVQ